MKVSSYDEAIDLLVEFSNALADNQDAIAAAIVPQDGLTAMRTVMLEWIDEICDDSIEGLITRLRESQSEYEGTDADPFAGKPTRSKAAPVVADEDDEDEDEDEPATPAKKPARTASPRKQPAPAAAGGGNRQKAGSAAPRTKGGGGKITAGPKVQVPA